MRQTVFAGDGGGTIFFRLDKSGKRLSQNLSIAYRAKGKEYVVSARTADLADAKKELRRLVRNRENAADGLVALEVPSARKITVQGIIDLYLADCEERGLSSLRGMRSHARPLLAAFGSVRALDVKPGAVSLYRKARLALVSPATVARELEILSAAFGYALDQEIINVAPRIKKPKIDNARTVVFPLERVPELIETATRINAEVGDFLQWQSFSAMRPKAIRLLRWDYLKDGVLTLPGNEDKNKFGRGLDLAGEAAQIIERRRSARRPGDTFIFSHGPRPLPDHVIRRVWNLSLKQMGLPSGIGGYVVYDLKKTACKSLVASGIPEQRAMFFSGHKTTSTFRRYTPPTLEENARDMETVSSYRRKMFTDKTASKTDNQVVSLRKTQ